MPTFTHSAEMPMEHCDTSPTIYPAVADWDGTFNLSRAGEMLNRWASPEFSTDWGTRDLSPTVSFYDPISYHQGSVWPLFTGWVALSEYRNGRSFIRLQLTSCKMQTLPGRRTWAQSLNYSPANSYRWLGRSTSHQLWSSAMVLTPTVRGMFGLEWSAAENTLTVTPNLPAQWNEAKIAGVPINNSRVSVEMRRTGSTLSVRLSGDGSNAIKLRTRAPGAIKITENRELRIPLPAVEVGIGHGLPEAGAVTSQLKVLDQQSSPHALRIQLSAPAASQQTLFLRVNDAKARLHIEGAEVSADSSQIHIQFPPGAGYVEKVVRLSW